MQVLPVQDAKARFSESLDRCLAEGPQMVTRQGVEASVLIPARPSLKALLLEDEARTEELVPVRGHVADFRALGVDVLNPFA